MTSERGQWTIMIYMSGDNNLGVDMSYALTNIRQAAEARGQKVNLMVYYDGNSLDVPTLYCDFTDFSNPIYVPAFTVRKRYTHVGRRFEDTFENQNAAEMYSILNFIDWCVNTEKRGRAADHYGIIFSGHGFGFQSISFLKDESSDYYLTIRKFRASLEKIRDEILGQPIDLIGFDCCVMGMLEIGYEIQECARVMIASEGSIPNAGWTYGRILGGLVSSGASVDLPPIATQFVHDFIETQKDFAVGGVSVDMSAWDLSKISPVASAVNCLGETMLMGLAEDTNIYAPLRGAVIQSHWESQSYMFEQNVDLKDFCECLVRAVRYLNCKEEIVLSDGTKHDFLGSLNEACTAVARSVDNAVLECGFSGGDYQYSNGIALFFPWTFQTYLFSEPSYSVLRFANDGGRYWNAFLLHFLRDVTLRGQNQVTGRRNPVLVRKPEADGQTKEAAGGPNDRFSNPADQLIKEAFQITKESSGKIITNPANRDIANSSGQIYKYPAFKLVQQGVDRIITNPSNRIITNPASRIITNPASNSI